jgi:hypothetical protein
VRDLDTDVLNALANDEIHIAVLGEFDFASGVERLWAGPEGYALDWDGETWTSLADLGQIDKISEAQGLADSRTRVSLRVNSDAVSEIGSDDNRGRPATLTLLLLDPDGVAIGPVHFRKTMGGLSVQAEATKDEGGETIVNEVISLELLDETANLGRNHFVRMTYEAGRRIDPDDHGLEWVSDPTVGNLGPVRDGRYYVDREGTFVQ